MVSALDSGSGGQGPSPGRGSVLCSSLMSRIERKYCSISTSYLTGLFTIFILLHIC